MSGALLQYYAFKGKMLLGENFFMMNFTSIIESLIFFCCCLDMVFYVYLRLEYENNS